MFWETGIDHPGGISLNKAGEMLAGWYYELPEKYPDKKCREMVVMPNHIHFIIENMGDNGDGHAGEGAGAHTGDNGDAHAGEGAHVGAPLRGRPPHYGHYNKKLNAPVGDLVDWYKTMTTNDYIRGVKQYGWKRFNGKLWQRNYYEHIIRSWEDYERIARYINNNPAHWKTDRFFT